MLGPIDHVWFWVSDMDRAIGFYRDTLALELVSRHGDEWAELDGKSTRLALHGAGPGRELPQGGAVAFEVEDLDEAKFALEMKGVRFDPHLGEVGGRARFASFSDPDGNRLQIIEYYEGH